jgi:hypothetical protein
MFILRPSVEPGMAAVTQEQRVSNYVGWSTFHAFPSIDASGRNAMPIKEL